jgi:hypothetical protein
LVRTTCWQQDWTVIWGAGLEGAADAQRRGQSADAGGEVRLVLSIGIDQGRVCAIRAIRNPDKLHDLNRALHATEREPRSEN